MTLQIILHATITDPDAYAELAAELPRHVEATEPGTLDYRWLRQDGGDGLVFIDEYASPGAFAQHFAAAKEAGFIDRLMACCEITGVHAAGDHDAVTDAILEGFGAARYAQVAGFRRQLAAPAA